MSSASRESQKFLKDFAPKRRTLNNVVAFTPHYAVFGMDSGDQVTAGNLCSDPSGKYCAEDPDGPGPITGKDVLEENVRQQCIHDSYKKEGRNEEFSSMPIQKVEYAEEFWNYIEKFLERCPMENFGLECSK